MLEKQLRATSSLPGVDFCNVRAHVLKQGHTSQSYVSLWELFFKFYLFFMCAVFWCQKRAPVSFQMVAGTQDLLAGALNLGAIIPPVCVTAAEKSVQKQGLAWRDGAEARADGMSRTGRLKGPGRVFQTERQAPWLWPESGIKVLAEPASLIFSPLGSCQRWLVQPRTCIFLFICQQIHLLLWPSVRNYGLIQLSIVFFLRISFYFYD